ncbi:uncharacterized protein LDX57_001396 [Aspergillus melleus]|uniref:uncharacterized protein n=1 Tax=Aspergillus melleus TaxID=138277 RepID=UPI001E8CA159|nr:uncharacterized protein LDX57_001396 [Aspergillus melleus]KAH8423637.1 hypothetical protein LDX57_001396 [Aspergillus melleus]
MTDNDGYIEIEDKTYDIPTTVVMKSDKEVVEAILALVPEHVADHATTPVQVDYARSTPVQVVLRSLNREHLNMSATEVRKLLRESLQDVISTPNLSLPYLGNAPNKVSIMISRKTW